MSFLDKMDAQMNYIVSLIKEIPKSSKKPFNKSLSKTKILSSLPILSNTISLLSTTNNNQKNDFSSTLEDNQYNLLTSENFPSSHLCNRNIRDLPLSKRNDTDFERLESYYILTMTDLIGRYLIHKTPNEFRQFLIEKVQCSQSFTDEITQLIETWTLHNLQIGSKTRTTTLNQYL